MSLVPCVCVSCLDSQRWPTKLSKIDVLKGGYVTYNNKFIYSLIVVSGSNACLLILLIVYSITFMDMRRLFILFYNATHMLFTLILIN